MNEDSDTQTSGAEGGSKKRSKLNCGAANDNHRDDNHPDGTSSTVPPKSKRHRQVATKTQNLEDASGSSSSSKSQPEDSDNSKDTASTSSDLTASTSCATVETSERNPETTTTCSSNNEDEQQPGPSGGRRKPVTASTTATTTTRQNRFAGRNYRHKQLATTNVASETDEDLEDIFNKCLSPENPNAASSATSVEPEAAPAALVNAEPIEFGVADDATTATTSSDASEDPSFRRTIDPFVITVDTNTDDESDTDDLTSSVSSDSSTTNSYAIPPFASEGETSGNDGSVDGPFSGRDREARQSKISKEMIHNIMHKPRPRYAWTALPALFKRQMGLTSNVAPDSFANSVYGSLRAVERLELMYKLQMHTGCVNALNFNKAGNLLVTGSDDLDIIVWKWASNEVMYKRESGHQSNIFQTKFLELGGNAIDIASSSRDGQIRHTKIKPCGDRETTVLLKHASAVNKLAVTPNNPFELLSAGEDGRIVRCDLRETEVERLVTVRMADRNRIPLYSIAIHPMDPEFCVSGRDAYVRVFDRRNIKGPVKLYCPKDHMNKSRYNTHITCAVYNYLGDEILASFSNDVFLFDTKKNGLGEYKHVYSGHRNNNTIKGVSFFGPRSEFVLSGSDCGNCFFWEKETEAIVQWMRADQHGAVNCVEPHPSFPILATSGLDYDIKIWVPSNETPPTFEGLENCVESNVQRRFHPLEDPSHIFDEPLLNFYVRQVCRNRRLHQNHNRARSGTLLDSSDDDDDDDDDDNDGVHVEARVGRGPLPCSPS